MKRAGMKVVCMVLAGCMVLGTVGCRNRTQEVETETLAESVTASETNVDGQMSFKEKMDTKESCREESDLNEEKESVNAEKEAAKSDLTEKKTDNKTSVVKKDTVVKTEDGEMIIVPQENSKKDSSTSENNNKQNDSKKNNSEDNKTDGNNKDNSNKDSTDKETEEITDQTDEKDNGSKAVELPVVPAGD